MAARLAAGRRGRRCARGRPRRRARSAGAAPCRRLLRRSARGVGATRYRLQVRWADGGTSIVDDPYRFPPVLGDLDVWLLGEGTPPASVRGAGRAPQRRCTAWPAPRFAVWAPNARAGQRGRRLQRTGTGAATRCACGASAASGRSSCPASAPAQRYKYELARCRRRRRCRRRPIRTRSQAELRPATASVVARAAAGRAGCRPSARAANRARCADQHLRSAPRLVAAPGRRQSLPDWDELARRAGCRTRASWASRTSSCCRSASIRSTARGATSRSACTRRPRASARRRASGASSRACHAAGLGVLLDWVPAHFPNDAHGLARFDGTPLYEYADPREGFHRDWNTLIYNFGRTEVRNFLVGNALFWLERYGVDGLRVDAVASMLYRDYSRKAGEWVPNVHGGRENLEAIAFLQRMNEVVGVDAAAARSRSPRNRPRSPACRGRPASGGLGFHYKWNMGWMHDTLAVHGATTRCTAGTTTSEMTLRPGLRLQRELRAAAVARRGGARQGLAARQDAGRRLAEVRQPARLLRLHVRPSGQEAAVHGRRVRAAARVEPRREPRLAPAASEPAARRACSGWCATSTRCIARRPALHELRLRAATASSGSIADDAEHSVLALRAPRPRRRAACVVVSATSRRCRARGYRIGVPQAGRAGASALNTDARTTAAATSARRRRRSTRRGDAVRTAARSRSRSTCRRWRPCSSNGRRDGARSSLGRP